MPLKLNKETVEYIQENFEKVLFENQYIAAPGIGNSLVFIKKTIIMKGAEPINLEVSVRWTEEGSLKEYVEVYLKSYTKSRVYTSRYNLSLSNRNKVQEKLNAIILQYEDYTKKFFVVTLFKRIQAERRQDFGHYLSGETNEVFLSLKEIDRIDTSVYAEDTLSAPTVYFTNGDSLSFDEDKFFVKLTK